MGFKRNIFALILILSFLRLGYCGFSTDDLTVTDTLTLPNDVIKDSHIDWGTGANQVSQHDLPDYLRVTLIINSPTATADGAVFKVGYALTIKQVNVLCVGGTNIIGQVYEYDANGANGATVDSSDITATAGTNATDDGTLSNAGIDSGDYIGWNTTSVSGTLTRVLITIYYTVD